MYWFISWWTSGCFHIWLLWIVLWWTSHTGKFLSPCFQFWEACISSRIIYMLFSLYEMFFPPCMHFIQLNPLLNSSFYSYCKKLPSNAPPVCFQSIQYISLSKSFCLYIVITEFVLSPFYTTWSWGQGPCLTQDLSSVLAQSVAYTKYSEIIY